MGRAVVGIGQYRFVSVSVCSYPSVWVSAGQYAGQCGFKAGTFSTLPYSGGESWWVVVSRVESRSVRGAVRLGGGHLIHLSVHPDLHFGHLLFRQVALAASEEHLLHAPVQLRRSLLTWQVAPVTYEYDTRIEDICIITYLGPFALKYPLDWSSGAKKMKMKAHKCSHC